MIIWLFDINNKFGTILKMNDSNFNEDKSPLANVASDKNKSGLSVSIAAIVPYLVTASVSFALGAVLLGNGAPENKNVASVEISSELKLKTELERWNTGIYSDVVGMKNDLSTIDTMVPEEIGVVCVRIELGTKNIKVAAGKAPVQEVGKALSAWGEAMEAILPKCGPKSTDSEKKEAAVRLRATEPLFINFVTVYSKYVPATAEEPASQSQTAPNENN